MTEVVPLGLDIFGIGEEDDAGGMSWQDSALCAQTDPEAFFPEKGGSTREARRSAAPATYVPSALSTHSNTTNVSASGAACPNANAAASSAAPESSDGRTVFDGLQPSSPQSAPQPTHPGARAPGPPPRPAPRYLSGSPRLPARVSPDWPRPALARANSVLRVRAPRTPPALPLHVGGAPHPRLIPPHVQDRQGVTPTRSSVRDGVTPW